MSPPEEESTSIDRQVAELQAELEGEARALGKLASALGALAKPRAYEDLSKLPALIERVEQQAKTMPSLGARGEPALELVRKELSARKQELREKLAPELVEACKREGLELRVIRREQPVEVRIPPFGVHIDREKGIAGILFAKQPIEACVATAPAILEAHARALASLSRDFQADRFFDACHRAWLAARGAGLAGASERVEIVDFLPYLAIQMQSSAFRVDPSERNYKGYTRARFAFDLHQLRNAGGLTHDGHRLNLGVATGTTASKKNRAVWIEDANGQGEFKLTIFFTKVEPNR